MASILRGNPVKSGMKNVCRFVAIIAFLVLAGCGDGRKSAADKAAQQMQRSFDAAPEDLKTKYNALKAAVEAGDIAKAKVALGQLQGSQSQFSTEQQGAVAELKQALMIKAATAAQNGDKEAAMLIQELRFQSRSR